MRRGPSSLSRVGRACYLVTTDSHVGILAELPPSLSSPIESIASRQSVPPMRRSDRWFPYVDTGVFTR